MNKENKNSISNTSGTSLLEIIVAVSLFIIIMVSVTQIFKMIAESQRNALAAENVQDNIRYIFEVISKEIRDAQPNPNDGSCSISTVANKVFNYSPDGILFFKNKDSICVQYKLVSGRFYITRGINAGFITPDEITINNLNFKIKDETIDFHGSTGSQALVMINLDAQNSNAAAKQTINIQTAISARYYE